ncbi:LOB domain-containing protein 37 [Ananas comosus]|uniref:LOB domain-containing protein 37 n=1 Tax=Ananas comosus TaxID=4615 RepID=A0A199VTA7_ANACO|nr:LOB domain-containing protein 37 [Ananas comosus]
MHIIITVPSTRHPRILSLSLSLSLSIVATYRKKSELCELGLGLGFLVLYIYIYIYIHICMMSCNGCRVLRKGCGEGCLLRVCLEGWVDGAEAQGHATLFVAKFFGRAGLSAFLSAVPLSHRPALFRSLLFEACGRTISPVGGAVGLLWAGNWHLCQAAVHAVLRGESIRPLPEDLAAAAAVGIEETSSSRQCDLDLYLTPMLPAPPAKEEKRRQRKRLRTPSVNSEGSVTVSENGGGGEPQLLNLFV